jgi:hypothetical protein
MTEPGLTAEEHEVLTHLANAWNEFCRLSKGHPGDAAEFTFHIHALQNIVGGRVAKRCNPEIWR